MKHEKEILKHFLLSLTPEKNERINSWLERTGEYNQDALKDHLAKTNFIDCMNYDCFVHKYQFAEVFLSLVRDECYAYQQPSRQRIHREISPSSLIPKNENSSKPSSFDLEGKLTSFMTDLAEKKLPSSMPSMDRKRTESFITRRINPTCIKEINKTYSSTFLERQTLDQSKSILDVSSPSFPNENLSPIGKDLSPSSTLLFPKSNGLSPQKHTIDRFQSSMPISERQNSFEEDIDILESMLHAYQHNQLVYRRISCLIELFFNLVFCFSYCSIVNSLEIIVFILLSLSKMEHYQSLNNNLFPEIVSLYHFASHLFAKIDLNDICIVLGKNVVQKLIESHM
jgi:hypothetical protein